MSNALKVVGIGCGGCLVLIIAAGVVFYSMLPDSMHVERSKVIDAPIEVVFPLVDTPSSWKDWDPWSEIDPDMENTYEGPPAGVGAISRWKSENPEVGNGSFEITESVPGERIVFDLKMMDEEMQSTITFTFKPTDNGVRVTWADDAELEGLGMRAFGMFADYVLGPMFEQGLGRLKRVAEKRAAELPSGLLEEGSAVPPVPEVPAEVESDEAGTGG